MNALYGPNFLKHDIANEALFSERRWEKYESARMKEACQESSVLPLLPLINGKASLRHMFRLEELALTLKRLFFFFFLFFCFVNCLLLSSFKSQRCYLFFTSAGLLSRGGLFWGFFNGQKRGEIMTKLRHPSIT